MKVKNVFMMALLSFLLILSACTNEQEVQTTSDGKEKTSFIVTDMYCSSCPFVVESAIKKVDGVKEVTIETKGTEGEVTVAFDDTKTDVNTIQKAVSDLGYGIK